MKLGYIFSAALLVGSFNLHAEQTPAKSAEEELPIVEFETKKQVQIEDETLLKKKKKQGNQMVLSDSANTDLNLSVVIAKKSKAKSSEQVQEEDFSRLDRELEVLK